MKKFLFLFLALLMPVFIYLFLKSFGRNEFNVPVLFADSVSSPVECEAYSYRLPYHVTDSVLQKLSWNERDSMSVIVFDDENKSGEHEIEIHLKRIFTEFKSEPLRVIRVCTDAPAESKLDGRLTQMLVTLETFKRLRRCVFLLRAEDNTVIIDRHKQIRGQYNLLIREDADRMIMQEMNILFKRY